MQNLRRNKKSQDLLLVKRNPDGSFSQELLGIILFNPYTEYSPRIIILPTIYLFSFSRSIVLTTPG
jgi:hypothetical protein